jgi:hypothetical protein
MRGHVEQCVERYLELSKTDESQLAKVQTPCIDDHQLSPEDFVAKGELAHCAARIVLKALFVARMSRPDCLWSVNTLAREVTKWNVACDKRLHRLISYMHNTKDIVQVCIVGDRPEDCMLALFTDASFAGDLRDSKSTTGSLLALVGPSTFVPISWMCKKQSAVSHSSSEAEVVALDAALRLEGIPALTLWDQVIEILSPEAVHKESNESSSRQRNVSSRKHWSETLDYVPPNIDEPAKKAHLVILEDNDAVIKMVIKGRSPAMRHVARTHRIDLDWLFEQIREDKGIGIRYVNTKLQAADILTKGQFTTIQWKSLCRLSNSVPNLLKEGGRKSAEKDYERKVKSEKPVHNPKKKERPAATK